MSTLYDSLNNFYKSPIGPIKKNESIFLRIRLDKSYNSENVQVIFYEYCAYWKLCSFDMLLEKSDELYDYYTVEISNFEVNIYEYYFSFFTNGCKKFLKRENDSWKAFVKDDLLACNWQLTVYEPTKTHPNMNSGIMYQIFPDRFFNSGKVSNLPKDRVYRNWGELPFYTDDKICSDFFGGDLQGIIEKLSYLKSLNVSVIYLTPIWESQSNHRYDTGCYDIVDPVLGNIDDFKELLNAAHDLGMIVILDAVLNHTGSDSLYFNKYNRYPTKGAYNSYGNSSFSDWYFFYTSRDCYESWWGFDTLPKLNQHSSSLIEYFFAENGIFDRWFSYGIDGVRLDVADELDNSTLKEIYNVSKRNKDNVIILGEVWNNASNKVNYNKRMEYFLGHELTSVMNYPVSNAILAYIRYGGFWANDLMNNLISVFKEDYPKEIAYSLMNLLSSHDSVRAITKLSGKEVDNHDKEWQNRNDVLSPQEYRLGRFRLMLSYVILFFIPGIPSIFYGDEVGLYGQKDPFCRKCFPWNRIDKKLLHFFKRLGKIRHSLSEFLGTAEFDIVNIDNDLFVFTRHTDCRYLYIFINRSDNVVDISKYFSDFDKYKVLFSANKNFDSFYLPKLNYLIVEKFF